MRTTKNFTSWRRLASRQSFLAKSIFKSATISNLSSNSCFNRRNFALQSATSTPKWCCCRSSSTARSCWRLSGNFVGSESEPVEWLLPLSLLSCSWPISTSVWNWHYVFRESEPQTGKLFCSQRALGRLLAAPWRSQPLTCRLKVAHLPYPMFGCWLRFKTA